MAAKAFDLFNYAHLLSEAHPMVPETEAENERLISMINDLTEREALTPEEEKLLDVLITLVEKFEEKYYATKRAAPHDVLREMMRARGMKPKDLYDIFGSSGTTSEVLRGKRAISKSAAKALAQRFNKPVDLFL